MPPTHTPNGLEIGLYTPRNYDGYNGVALLRRALNGQPMSDARPHDFHNITYAIAFSATPQGTGFWSDEHERYANEHTLSSDARLIIEVWLGLWRPPMPEGMTREVAQAALNAATNTIYYNDIMPAVQGWLNSSFEGWPETDRATLQAERAAAGRTGRNAPPNFGERTRALLTAWAGETQPEPPLPSPAWAPPPWAAHEQNYYNDHLRAAIDGIRNYGPNRLAWPDWTRTMLPGDEEGDAFALYDGTAQAEAARAASPQWPLIYTRRRNAVRAIMREHGTNIEPLPEPVLPEAAAVEATVRTALKRVNVERLKAKYPAVNGARAGCTCSACKAARKEVDGKDPLTARTPDQTKAAADYAKNGRTFGVEIECFLPPNQAASDAGLDQHRYLALKLGEAGARARSGEGVDRWGVKGDASLKANSSSDTKTELVSPILRGEDGLAQIKTAVGALNGMKAYVNKTAGLHVHVGAKDFTLGQRVNLLSQFIRYERFFDLILPASRRSNRYANSLRERASATKNKSLRAAEHAILSLLEVKTEQDLANITNWDYHHNALADARGKHGTFEFRQHSGTVNAEKIVNWVRLILAFTEAAKDKPALPFYSRKLSDEEEMEKFFDTFSIPRDLRTYYRKRHAALYANPENDD